MKNLTNEEWVKQAIERGFDDGDIKEICEKQGTSQKKTNDLLNEYYKQTEEKEPIKLGFFAKRKLKKLIKLAVRKLDSSRKTILDITTKVRRITGS